MKKKEYELVKIILDKHIVNKDIKVNILKDIQVLVESDDILDIPNKKIIKR